MFPHLCSLPILCAVGLIVGDSLFAHMEQPLVEIHSGPPGQIVATLTERNRPTGAAFIALDGGQHQNDDNSCGPNSASRVLRYYGFHASYDDVKRCFHNADPILSNIGLGTPGAHLANLMRQFGYHATASQATVEQILALLSEGKPVVAMVRVGTVDVASQLGGVGQMLGKAGSWVKQANAFPLLHWIALQGFDRARGVLYFTDTNGRHSQVRFTDFERAFHWSCASDFASKLLEMAGVTPGNIVY